MTNNLLKSLVHFGALLVMLSCSVSSYADGHMQRVTNVLEEVRIVDISSDSNQSSSVGINPSKKRHYQHLQPPLVLLSMNM